MRRYTGKDRVEGKGRFGHLLHVKQQEEWREGVWGCEGNQYLKFWNTVVEFNV